MAETEIKRLSKVAKEFNVGLPTIVDFLISKGHKIDANPNAKITPDLYTLLMSVFSEEKRDKEEAASLSKSKIKKEADDVVPEVAVKAKEEKEDHEDQDDEIMIRDLQAPKAAATKVPEVLPEEPAKEAEVVKAKVDQGVKINIKGKIDLNALNTKTKPDKRTKKKEADPIASVPAAKEVTATQEPTEVPAKLAEEKPETVAVEETKAPVEKTEEQPEEVSVQETPVATAEEAVGDTDAPEDAPEIIPGVIEAEDANFIKTQYQKLEGPKILSKIILPNKDDKKKPVASSNSQFESDKKKKRKRIKKSAGPNEGANNATANTGSNTGGNRPANTGNNPSTTNSGPNRGRTGGGGDNKFQNSRFKKAEPKAPLTEVEIQIQIKETLARLSGQGTKSKAAKYRRVKRDEVRSKIQEEAEQSASEQKTIKVTEFVSAAQLATMMNVQVTQIISTCMSLGLFVSINQRLDAETISIIADEYGYKLEFVSVEVQEAIREEEDRPEDLISRPPIVTVMGHVDHGKTSLLDYIRKSNVIAGEAGGITQHIGAYNVKLENGKAITFLDTPGHEAFTAMRARGAQATDVAIIVIAADDSVMPQTIEAINHAAAAGVPIVFAINKIDKPGANPDRIREALAAMNYLVEEWGGKFQCQEISAKQGKNIELLLDKVLLEAEMKDLKANPSKNAVATIIESTLDKGRGYVATILVKNGTLRVGDFALAGCYSGKVKALFNERGQAMKEAGPAIPAVVLGLNGAPQAGDQFNVMTDEREAKDIANKRLQLQREQGIRTQKHITLDEIGRRLAIGDFKELNVIVKGDVDGSIEALSDSLLKLSTEKIQVKIIHKSVGAITESDVLLASASNAIIVGFQVRPTASARKLAETEQIDIRLYSIIYDAINEVKAAMEGMLAPEFVEKIVCNIEIREVFVITKVGTIAGCMVLDGKVTRQTKVRVIRDGIVIHSGSLGSLKRFKDDVKEVASGFECGLNIDKFNDIKQGDIIEGYEMVEVKAKL